MNRVREQERLKRSQKIISIKKDGGSFLDRDIMCRHIKIRI